MISEDLWDTEDWSNVAENSALHHRKYIWKYIKIEKLFEIVIFHNITVYTVFWSNKWILGEQK